MGIIDRADFVNRDDVRMIERGNGFGFLLKAAQAFGVEREFCRQNFQGDVTFEFSIARQIHFAHSALAQQGKNFVLIEMCAWVDLHGKT